MSKVTTSIFSTPKQVTNIVAIKPVSGSVPSTTKNFFFHKYVLKVAEIFTKGLSLFLNEEPLQASNFISN